MSEHIGLSQVVARSRLAVEGPNAVLRPRPRRLIERVGAQLTDPLVALLLVASVVTLVLRDWTDTAIIVLVVVLNTAIGVAQQVRADRAIAALDDLTAPTAHVVRDGIDQRIPAAGLVRGDLVRLEAGDIVPADITLGEAFRLQLDEAALTGESLPVAREAGEEASAGTVVVTGRGCGLVTRIGGQSALGRIATLVAKAGGGPTPLQRRLAGLGRVLGAVAILLCLIVFGIGVATGQPILTMALIAVSLVVAAVPESLPAVVTLSLALGARRMARRNAIPRNLHAVETLGSVTILASDKTGTLTEGRMAVQRAFAGDHPHMVSGIGYEPKGEVEPAPTPQLLRLAEAAVLCSDATLTPPTTDSRDWTAVGDPMEAALVAFAGRCGLDPQEVRRTAPRIAEHPFDQATRQMTTIHRVRGGVLTVCKGAPESVLTGPIVDPQAPDSIAARAHAENLAAQGLRVMVVATAATAEAPNPVAPTGLRVAGVIGIGDPLRAAATGTATSFAQAGVRLILITGDHPATAAAIAAQIGIWQPGDPVGNGSDSKPAHQTRVFARILPEQKLNIIAALRKAGNVVAMTGDGVNDAPALRHADIGVAMGGGTEVARQAADLVLVDDNLDTVTAAIAEGRRVYDNIRRFLSYGLSGGLAEILVMLVGPALGMPVPLLPGQILWINLLTHGLPGVALGAEPAEPDVLRRPPRPPSQRVLGDGLVGSVLATGALLAAVSLGAAMAAMDAGWPWQSMLFVTLGLTQLGVALAVRTTAARWRNPSLPTALALSGLAQIAAVTVAPLRSLLGTQPLTATQLGACLLVAVVPGGVLWLRRVAAGPWSRNRQGTGTLPTGPTHP